MGALGSLLILGPPTAQIERVIANLPSGFATRFRDDMLPALWRAAEDHGIDPVGMVAQAAKETAWGRFGNRVRPAFHNTCGLKIHTSQQALFRRVTDGDRPLAHAMFANWETGATAHAQHLLAYTGKRDVSGLIIDPRFTLVTGEPISRWSELGGKWAPSPTYGIEIESIMQRLSSGNDPGPVRTT